MPKGLRQCGFSQKILAIFNMRTILLTGAGGPAGLALTDLLLERGFDLAGADMRELAFPGRVFYTVPPAREPAFLDVLRGVAEKERPALLIPTVTEELPVVAASWCGWLGIPALVSTPRAVEIADDKYLTARALSAAGVPVPRFALPSELHSPGEVGSALGWPCLSKPRQGRGGRGVTVYAERNYPALAALDDRFILQEFAPGTDYAPNVFIGREGSLAVVLEKTALKEGLVGNALSVRRVDAADVAEVAINAALAAGLNGPQDVDIRRRADGQPVVLEINARFGANSRHAPEILEASLRSFGLWP
jgi:carbamoylphosphate synthase large subunit